MMELHPIFAECCETNELHARYPVTRQPFYRGGYVYATNGRIVVRRRHQHKPTPMVPDVGSLPWPMHTCIACGSQVCDKCGVRSSCDVCRDSPHYTPEETGDVLSNGISEEHAQLLYRHRAKLFWPTRPIPAPFYFTVGREIEGLVMQVKDHK